jgi:hypothetical protein
MTWPVSCTRPWNPPTSRYGSADVTDAGFHRLHRHTIAALPPPDPSLCPVAVLRCCTGTRNGQSQDRNWLLFEADGLAKTVEDTFVCPYLLDLDPDSGSPDVTQPESWHRPIREAEEAERQLTSSGTRRVTSILTNEIWKRCEFAIQNPEVILREEFSPP